ncbi:MAG: hypothetical protein HOG49_24880 [Candidatus Scalindua sp.]|jgi:hypothetical protein|nr:hypothetical protein [Candidatus Scalindua sp.]
MKDYEDWYYDWQNERVKSVDETLRRLVLLIREKEDNYSKLTEKEEDAYARRGDSETQKEEGKEAFQD